MIFFHFYRCLQFNRSVPKKKGLCYVVSKIEQTTVGFHDLLSQATTKWVPDVLPVGYHRPFFLGTIKILIIYNLLYTFHLYSYLCFQVGSPAPPPATWRPCPWRSYRRTSCGSSAISSAAPISYRNPSVSCGARGASIRTSADPTGNGLKIGLNGTNCLG